MGPCRPRLSCPVQRFLRFGSLPKTADMSDDFETKYARHKELCAKANEQNKTVLFAALAPTGITTISVEFDGEGDSGQINGISARAGDQPAQLPVTRIALQQVSWGDTEATSSEFTLEAAVEALCYDYLEQEHGGWENNDGAYGEFHIDITERTIDLEFYSRYTDVEKYSHSF